MVYNKQKDEENTMQSISEMTADEAEYERYITAIHEAGHFVIGMVALSGLPRRITIVPNDNALGYCDGGPLSVEQAQLFLDSGIALETLAPALKCTIIITLAGGIATEMLLGYDDFLGADDDAIAVMLMLKMLYGEAWEAELDHFYNFTWRLLSHHKGATDAIQTVASYLMENPTLENEAVNPLWNIAKKVMIRSFTRMRKKVDAFTEG